MKNKIYEFEIHGLYDLDSGSTVSYYTKGHHDKQLFLQTISKDYDDEIKLDEIKHQWAKWLFQGDYKALALICSDNRRKVKGEFPVTYIDITF